MCWWFTPQRKHIYLPFASAVLTGLVVFKQIKLPGEKTSKSSLLYRSDFLIGLVVLKQIKLPGEKASKSSLFYGSAVLTGRLSSNKPNFQVKKNPLNSISIFNGSVVLTELVVFKQIKLPGEKKYSKLSTFQPSPVLTGLVVLKQIKLPGEKSPKSSLFYGSAVLTGLIIFKWIKLPGEKSSKSSLFCRSAVLTGLFALKQIKLPGEKSSNWSLFYGSAVLTGLVVFKQIKLSGEKILYIIYIPCINCYYWSGHLQKNKNLQVKNSLNHFYSMDLCFSSWIYKKGMRSINLYLVLVGYTDYIFLAGVHIWEVWGVICI